MIYSGSKEPVDMTHTERSVAEEGFGRGWRAFYQGEARTVNNGLHWYVGWNAASAAVAFREDVAGWDAYEVRARTYAGCLS